MAFCSTHKIEINGGSPITLVDIGDTLEQEVSSSWSALTQDSTPIDGDTVVRGRGGRAKAYSFAVIREHASPEVARRFADDYGDSLPGGTVSATITYATGTPKTTTRAHLESANTSMSGGRTVTRYVLRWQIV